MYLSTLLTTSTVSITIMCVRVGIYAVATNVEEVPILTAAAAAVEEIFLDWSIPLSHETYTAVYDLDSPEARSVELL